MASSIRLWIQILGNETRVPLWCPNIKQNIAILRRTIERKLFPNENDLSLRLFFNGNELLDQFSIENYEISDGHVIQVKNQIKVNHDEMIVDDEVKSTVETEISLDLEINSINEDDYYSIGDHIDAFESESGSWIPATVTGFKQSEFNNQHLYLISYRKPSLGSNIPLPLQLIRPQSDQPLTFNDIYPTQSIFVLIDSNWYVAIVERTNRDNRSKSSGKVLLSLVRGNGSNGSILEQRSVCFRTCDFRRLESNVLKVDRDTEMELRLKNGAQISRFYQPDCNQCFDNQQIQSCIDCGCQICHGKESPDKQLLCDECDRPTHLWCLREPLQNLPKDEDEFFCDQCRNDSLEHIQIKQKQYLEKKLENIDRKPKTNWGFGMSIARVGGNTNSAIFGPIPGIYVGTWWRFRFQVSQSGIHAPLVSGIHGKENVGAYSILFTGLYPEDVDLGDDIYYTGIGGRNNKNGRRIGSLQFVQDQKMTNENKALAMSCAIPFDPKGGNAKTNWKMGKPIRLLRSGNGRKHSSLYLPKIGIRYDGIYRVVKYWSEIEPKSRFRFWRFHLKRDDPSPSPWTERGRYHAKKFGLDTPIYPDGWCLEMAGKRHLKIDYKYLSKKRIAKNKKSKAITVEQKTEPEFSIPNHILSMIESDLIHHKQWTELLTMKGSKEEFLVRLRETFVCNICLDDLYMIMLSTDSNMNGKQIISLACSHLFCSDCIDHALRIELNHCPACRSKTLNLNLIKPNLVLKQIFNKIKEL